MTTSKPGRGIGRGRRIALPHRTNDSRPLYTSNASPGSTHTPCALAIASSSAPVTGLPMADVRDLAVARHVEQDASRNQAVAERGDVAKPGAVRVDLLRRIAAVPHAVAVPHVAQRIHVRDRDAVILEPVIVDDRASGAPLIDSDEMLVGLNTRLRETVRPDLTNAAAAARFWA